MKISFGHLYSADMNPPRRSKPGKIRPVVVVQSTAVIDAGSPGVVVVPTTSKSFRENALRVHLPAGVAGNAVASDVLVDQVHTLDLSLFRRELGRIPPERMARIVEGLRLLLQPDEE